MPVSMSAEVFVLGFQRPELLACALGSLCGFNACKPHVIDDGSSDARVAALLASYYEAGLLATVDIQPHRGIGAIRRRMIDRFLAGDAAQLVQVEADMLIGPGQVQALTDAYAGIKAFAPDLHFLNCYHHVWCKRLMKVLPIGPYRLAITDGASEAYWTSDRAALQWAVGNGKIPADSPDLQLWTLPPVHGGLCGASLYAPEISCQHIGAGKLSLIYGDFAWQWTLYRERNETLRGDAEFAAPIRQPFPAHPLAWPGFQDEMPASALRLYEYLRATSPVALPEMPNG